MMLDKDQNLQLPLLETSSINIQDSVESFSDKQIQILQTQYDILSTAKINLIKIQLKKAELLKPEIKGKIEKIIDNIIQIKSINAEILPNIIQKIIENAKNNFNDVNISSPLYLQNITGASKTLREITENSEKNIQNKDSNNTQTIDQNIKENYNINSEKNQINSENNTKNKEREKIKKNIENMYEINKKDINASIPANFDKEAIINKIPPEQLKTFREIFGYTFDIQDIILPDGTKKENYEAWMMNDSVDNQIAKFIYYYAHLNNKIIQSQKPNSKITITEREKQQLKIFHTNLEWLWISDEVLYHSIDIKSLWGKNEDKRRNRKFIEEWNQDHTLEKINTKWDSSNLSSDLGNYFDEAQTDGLTIPPIFSNSEWKPREGFDNASLIDAFPLPKGISLHDFEWKKWNIRDMVTKIIHLTNGRYPFPLIEQSTQNNFIKQIAMKRLIVWYFLKANPGREIPEYLIKTLYPPKTWQLVNKRWEKLKNQNRAEILEETQERLILPLMKNNFTSSQIEKKVGSSIKKWKLSYLSNLIKDTPGLEDFSFKPSEIHLSNNNARIPLYLHGEEKKDMELIIEWDTVYMTSRLENQTNETNEIKPGKIKIGTINNFQSYTTDVISWLSWNIIKESLKQNNPQEYFFDNINENIQKNNRDTNENNLTIRASIAHGLSKNKVQNTIFDIMKTWDHEGIHNEDLKPSNPFYNTLHNFEQNDNNEKKVIDKNKNPDTFKIFQMIRNIWINSAWENDRLAKSFLTFQNLLEKNDFNQGINNYIDNHPQEEISNKNALLHTLSSKNRKSPESLLFFLQLFSTETTPWKADLNTINIDKFEATIQALDQTTDFESINWDTLISSKSQTIEEISQKYNKSAESLLDEELYSLDDGDHTSTYLA